MVGDVTIQQTTNLGVGSSNLPRCANKINDLRHFRILVLADRGETGAKNLIASAVLHTAGC